MNLQQIEKEIKRKEQLYESLCVHPNYRRAAAIRLMYLYSARKKQQSK